jgi:hypothetical protein
MNYFSNCSTVEQIKQAYRHLAFQYHPDLGGDLETMKEVNKQYEIALKNCDGQVSIDSEGKEHKYWWNEETETLIMEMISNLLSLKMDNCDVLLIGTWLWITGDTKPYKENLKSLGCRWHSKRGCWYYATEGQRKFSRRSNASLTELAGKYGVTKVEDLERKPNRKKLA